jgi:hypothetical protein
VEEVLEEVLVATALVLLKEVLAAAVREAVRDK